TPVSISNFPTGPWPRAIWSPIGAVGLDQNCNASETLPDLSSSCKKSDVLLEARRKGGAGRRGGGPHASRGRLGEQRELQSRIGERRRRVGIELAMSACL